jgi:hypothetical protein
MLKKSNLYSIHANRGVMSVSCNPKSFCMVVVFFAMLSFCTLSLNTYALGAFGRESNSSITPKDNASSVIMAEFRSVVS